MKRTLKKYPITYQGKMLTALILTSILSVGGGLTMTKSATAGFPNFTLQNPFVINNQNSLPAQVASAVRRDVFIRERISPSTLKIVDYSPETWSNGCLDLPQPDEFCTKALVPGWRVTVGAGNQTLVYHTNDTGSVIRLNEEASTITGN